MNSLKFFQIIKGNIFAFVLSRVKVNLSYRRLRGIENCGVYLALDTL
jgi:hypothetical protein